MPMTPPINRVPPGLLDLFGIKSGGRTPQVLTEQLQASMNLQEWYEQAAVTHVMATHVGLGAGSANWGFSNFATTTPAGFIVGGVLICPQNEVWILKPSSAVWWSFNLVAGSDAQFSLVIRGQGAGGNFWRAVPSTQIGYTVSSAARGNAGAAFLREPVFLYGGDIIQVLNFGATVAAGGSVTLFGSLDIVRMKV